MTAAPWPRTSLQTGWGHIGATLGPQTIRSERTTPDTNSSASFQHTDQTWPSAPGRQRGVAAARSAAWPQRARCPRLHMSQPVNVTCWHQTADASPEWKLRATLTRRLNAGAAPPVEVAVWESPDQGDDGAPGRVQGEDHGDTPAVKVENVADDGSQREVEGGDHRFPLRLDHRGQQPPVDPAAQDRGRRQDLPGRLVQRRRPSPQGLDQGRGPRRCTRPSRGPPTRHQGG